MNGTDSDLIGVIEKNRGEDVRVALSSFNGVPLIDIRIYADFGNGPDRNATRKGASLRVERLPELIALLTLAADKARATGLIE